MSGKNSINLIGPGEISRDNHTERQDTRRDDFDSVWLWLRLRWEHHISGTGGKWWRARIHDRTRPGLFRWLVWRVERNNWYQLIFKCCSYQLKICYQAVWLLGVAAVWFTPQQRSWERVGCFASYCPASPPASPWWCWGARPGRPTTSGGTPPMMPSWPSAATVVHLYRQQMRSNNRECSHNI